MLDAGAYSGESSHGGCAVGIAGKQDGLPLMLPEGYDLERLIRADLEDLGRDRDAGWDVDSLREDAASGRLARSLAESAPGDP